MTGACLCGDVAFEVEAPFVFMVHCHCSMCRKAGGAAFSTTLGVARDRFRWVRGVDAIRRYASSSGYARPFCARCGSAVPHEAGDQAHVPAGGLDGDPGTRPQAHLFVGSKAPWHEIADALRRFEAYPPGFGEAVAFARRSESAPGTVRGGCLCGGVAYEIAGTLAGPIIDCHCSRCRKARGAAHAANVFVEDLARFRWLRGEELLDSYKVPEAERFAQTFCRTCGGKMPGVNRARGRVVVPAGSLDDDPGAREELHIFVGSKAPWFEILDGLPQHDGYPPGPYPPASRRA